MSQHKFTIYYFVNLRLWTQFTARFHLVLDEHSIFFMNSRSKSICTSSPDMFLPYEILSRPISYWQKYFSSVPIFCINAVLFIFFLYISLQHHTDPTPCYFRLPSIFKRLPCLFFIQLFSMSAYDFIQMQTTWAQFKRCIYLAWNCFCSCIFVVVASCPLPSSSAVGRFSRNFFLTSAVAGVYT